MTDNKHLTGGGRNRVIGLDLLRIAMAFLIYLFHSNCHLGCTYGFMTNFISVGSIAMTGFFMLSGYALNLSYGNKDLTNWSEIKLFYIKRFISIYPLYIVVGTVFILMMIIAGKQSIADNIILLPIEIFGLQSMFSGALFAYAHNGGTWFISCLLLSYLIFPIALSWTKNLTKKGRIILLFALMTLLILIPFVAHRFNEGGMYTNPFYRLIEFSVGIILSQMNSSIKNTSKDTRISLSILITSTLCLLIGVSLINDYHTTIAEICFPVVIYTIARLPFSHLQNSKPLKYLSAISYAFFLGQFFVWNPIKYLMLYTGKMPNMVLITISFIGCFVAAVVLHELIEIKSSKYLKTKLTI